MSTRTERATIGSEAPSLCLMSWVSWRSIFAGALTSVAIGIVLALLGVALGFTVIDPMDSDPMAGVGLTFGLWTLISGVLSLTAGGFVAGMFSGQRGCVHGFLSWAIVLLLGVFSTSIATGMALQSIGGILGSGVSTAASAITDQAGDLADRVMESMQNDSQSESDAPRIMAILRDTGVEQLQPSYMMNQANDARRDMTNSLQRMTLDNYDSVIAAFLNRQQERLAALQNQQVDRNAAAQGLMRSRDISRDEADELLNEALAVYNYRLDQMESGLYDAQQNFEDARVYFQQLSDDARRQADDMASAAAKSALMAAIALILGAIGSTIGGRFGQRYSVHCERV